MKVVILCGGLGTRIREETEFRPKPMVEIGGRPILWHIMKIYAHYGFKEFILCLGYKGEVVKEYFYNYELLNNDFTIQLGHKKGLEIHSTHNEKDWKVTLADTGDWALKGSRLKRVEKYIDDDLFMMTYGDGVANVNLHDLLSFHKKHERVGTVLGVHPPSRFGELLVMDDRVLSFTEKPQTSVGLINGGFFVFKREIFDYLTDDDHCDLEYGALKQLVEDGQLMTYELKGEWECMDNLRDMEHLNKIWNTGKAFWQVWE
jgi:glucose-1-phosphate cytidylyltransferase